MNQPVLIRTSLILALACPAHAAVSFQPAGSAPLKFAAEEIQRAAKDVTQPVPDVVISVTPGAAQSYRIERDGAKVRVFGGDATGAMYGGLDVAEAIRIGGVDQLAGGEHKPHIERRGIKFNIPRDVRTPSYSDNCTSAQANIPEMWSLEFWHEFLDQMARDRFNVLTLWNLHPFPSIVKVPEFSDVALDDVWRTAMKHLENALAHWKRYATLYDRQYTPQLLNRIGPTDIPALTAKAAADIHIDRTWKPGTPPLSRKGNK